VHVSQAYRRIWTDRTGASDRHAIVPNGIELAEFSVNTNVEKPKESLKIFSISRLVPGKRIGDALVALAKLRDQSIDFRYVSIGDGPERPALEKLTAELDLTDRVTFLGAMPHEVVIKELCTSDILLHPSEWESFGIAVAEAMAANVAVIAARSPGPNDIVEHGITGYLHEAGDVVTLTNQLERLAKNPVLRKQFGELGHERILNKFSWGVHMSQMLALWQDAIPNPSFIKPSPYN